MKFFKLKLIDGAIVQLTQIAAVEVVPPVKGSFWMKIVNKIRTKHGVLHGTPRPDRFE